MINIILNNVFKGYRNKNTTNIVVENLSVKISDNNFYCLFGPSGCGKTTLLDLVGNLLSPDKGEIMTKPRELKIGYVFQNDRLLPWKTVEQNLDFVLEKYEENKNIRHKLIRICLKDVELEEKRDMFPGELSGGEKQRVNLARALIVNPDVILMDEPFSHLDEITANKLRGKLLSLYKKKQPLVIFVTHNILEAIYLSDYILVANSKPIVSLNKIKVFHPKDRELISFEESASLLETKKTVKRIYKLLG